jgi:hypothetical protein
MRGAPRLPPADFVSRKLPLCQAGGVFHRCGIASRPLLAWDARNDSRFSAPDLPFPVLYLASSKLTGFWECFGDELIDRPRNEKRLSARALGVRRWVRFTIKPSLRIVDLTNPDTLRAMGADGATFLADYDVTQRWSKELMLHPANVDGLRYRSRLDSDHHCLAIFGRPQLRRAARRFHPMKEKPLLQDAQLLAFLAEHDIALI